MTEIRAIVPADFADRVAACLADGGYADPGKYARDLILRDLEGVPQCK